ncbi:MAG: GuaB3 family IMP dehydrogenase-related protein [Mycobacteriales bacterium]
MPESYEIGTGKSARRGYRLSDVSIVPTRRTRSSHDVSIGWQIDAFPFELPMIGHPSDATMSPDTAIEVGQLGGLGVLNAEGLWTRYDDPRALFGQIADGLGGLPVAEDSALLQELYSEPVKPELIGERIRTIRDAGVTVAVRLSPQSTVDLASVVLDAGVDLLVVQGTIVSAERVSQHGKPLNLKEFIADLDVPVIVGGAATYQTALHLMRTGAAGVIVGDGSSDVEFDDVLGIEAPMASAISDAAAARRDYLDETGGRYVHVIADGEIDNSASIAKAIACGADAVAVGRPLSRAESAPGGGAWWRSAAAHPKLPRGFVWAQDAAPVGMSEILLGPTSYADGTTNLFGALARTMAKTGFSDLKEFQRVGLILRVD